MAAVIWRAEVDGKPCYRSGTPEAPSGTFFHVEGDERSILRAMADAAAADREPPRS